MTYLSLSQIQIPGQLPALLFGNIRIEEELFLKLQSLEFRVRFAFLTHGHLTGPFERIGWGAWADGTDAHR